MAKFVVTAAYVRIGGTDYEGQISSATLEVNGAELDATNFESAGWKEIEVGEKSASVSFNFKKDSAQSGLDAAIWTAFNAGSSLAVALRRDQGAISTDNPEYQFNVKVTGWMPVAGEVNQLYQGSVTWPVTGSITRDTTP